MNTIDVGYVPASDILEKLGISEAKFLDRFKAISTDVKKFIETAGLKEKVLLNSSCLGHMLIDYFVDISRMKLIHQVEHANTIKITAYTAYWFLKNKPIQAISCNNEAMDINEKFVAMYLLDFLSASEEDCILDRNEAGILGFQDALIYFLKYRVYNAVSIEMLLISFFAGQIYQDPNMADKLPSLDIPL